MQLTIKTKSRSSIAERLRTAKVDKKYLALEELNIKMYISQVKQERNSIMMSNEKYHTSFSL